ncbi:MAG: N-acetylmuramoyl-L-alanine amidase [Thermomicrobiales bacterium]
MTDTKRSLRIVVVQGHRNTSGGDPREAQRTPAIANAIVAALHAAGHEAICVQHADGTRDDWFAGTLDAVARAVMAHHREKPVDLMLDIHLEGDGANTPGVFAIVPDGDALQTLTAYTGTDNWASNTLDRAYAAAIARHIARETGMPVRTRNVVEPGVMSERQTHVGADLGWRLAMFGYTAPAHDTMARLVIECGNIVSDAARIFSEVFPVQVARGVVAGIAEVAGRKGTAPTTPDPLPVVSFPPFGTTRDLREPRSVMVVVPMLRARQWADTTQPILAEWPKGHRFFVRGWIVGEAVAGNPVWWLTGQGRPNDRRWRVWSGGTDCAGTDVLALPVQEPGVKEAA